LTDWPEAEQNREQKDYGMKRPLFTPHKVANLPPEST
jgi:hypothetical protein